MKKICTRLKTLADIFKILTFKQLGLKTDKYIENLSIIEIKYVQCDLI